MGYSDLDRIEKQSDQPNRIRNELSSAILRLSSTHFNDFCETIIHLQYFPYKLNGTVGAESEEYIPAGQEKYFKREVFDGKAPVLILPKTISTCSSPGIIIQDCLNRNNPGLTFTQGVQNMCDPEFIDFLMQIELLDYFSDIQSGHLFSRHPELIPKDDEHFLFIDEHYFDEEVQHKY